MTKKYEVTYTRRLANAERTFADTEDLCDEFDIKAGDIIEITIKKVGFNPDNIDT